MSVDICGCLRMCDAMDSQCAQCITTVTTVAFTGNTVCKMLGVDMNLEKRLTQPRMHMDSQVSP